MAHVLVIEDWLRVFGSGGGALVRALAREGHRFTFAARNLELYRAARDRHGGAHPVLALAERVVETETHALQALAEHMAALHARDPFDAVMTACDFYLEAVAVVAEHLGVAGNDPAAVRVAYRKHLVRAAEQRAGLPSPHCFATESEEAAQAFARSVGFPVVVKPTDLGGSELVRRVDDARSLAAAFAAVMKDAVNTRGQPRDRLALIEELLSGPEVSVETFTAFGRTRVIGVTDKAVSGAPAFIETLHVFPSALPAEERAQAEAAALATLGAIGFSHGLAHTEVKLTPDGARVVEVNTRVAGGHIPRLIELTTGVSPIALGIELALGRAPESPRVRGAAAVAYVLPPRAGRVKAVATVEALTADAGLVELELPEVGAMIARLGGDNDDRIGHLIVRAADAVAARALAEARRAALHIEVEALV